MGDLDLDLYELLPRIAALRSEVQEEQAERRARDAGG